MVNTKKAELAVLFVAMSLQACAYDEAHRYYSKVDYPPKTVDQVELLYVNPKRPYVVIADFQARRTTPKYMVQRAAEVGADAVIVETLGGYKSKSDNWAMEDRHAKWYSRITGTAIRYVRKEP